MHGRIHSIETAGMVDGPGIRTVIFFAGCPLRCLYCHNPDTWDASSGKFMSVDELLSTVLKYKSYHRSSGGGVTITGGEPLMQPEFLRSFLVACKSEGVHTALDTSGFATSEVVAQVLPHVDLLLLDIKTINSELYRKITGQELAPTLATLDLAREMHTRTWIRTVLVPGLTDNEGDFAALGEYLRNYPNIERVEVLPFSKIGEHKWQNMQLEYTLYDTSPPSEEEIERIRRVVNAELETRNAK